MKIYYNVKKIVFPVIILLLFMGGCSKNTLTLTYEMADTLAHVKINFASAYTVGKNMQIKINGVRVGILSSSNPNSPLPGGAYNLGNTSTTADYLALKPGTMTLSVSIPKVVNTVDSGVATSNVDSVVLYSAQITIPDYHYYTIHIADTASSTREMTLLNNLTQPDSGYFKMRFVNLMPNSTALDAYYTVNGVKTRLAANILYLGTSDYVTIPVGAIGPITFISAGLPSSSAALASMTVQLPNTNQRVYTAYVKGYKLVSTGGCIPAVGVIYER